MNLDARQLDLFPASGVAHAAEPLASVADWTPRGMVDRDPHGRPIVATRAAQYGGLITHYHPDEPEPFELAVRGVETVISFSGGFCTHAIDAPGTPYWSETGFRSFGFAISDPAEIINAIERFIDAPANKGGCGGRLTAWWPGHALQWRNSLAFELKYARDRREMWAQWGPERWAEAWAQHDARQAALVDQMRRDGIDPNRVGPPVWFKGKWPQIG